MYLYKKRNILLGISTLFILSGCSGGGTTVSSTEESTQTEITHPVSTLELKTAVKALNINDSSATIEWELNNYATGQVEYGITINHGKFSTKEESFKYNKHVQMLSNLLADTIYHYRVISEDAHGNRVVSKDRTFKTPSRNVSIIIEPTPVPAPAEAPISAPAEAPISSLASKAIQQGKVTDSATGEPLANVEVSIGTQTATTNAQGFYDLTDISVSDRTVVTFKHESYCTNSKIIAIKQYSNGTTLSPNYLETTLDKYDDMNNADSQNEKWWRYYFGIKIPGGIYTANNGNDYSGNAIAKVAYEDVSTEKGRDTFPGAYEGRNNNNMIIPFVSYGFMVIELEDENGSKLGLSADISLTFNSAKGTIAEEIPLWYYDYAQGIWIEEGYATRLPDGKYEGTVSHPGTWSLSQPIESDPGIYTDRILYPDGTPAKNLRVHVIGENWIKTDFSTDENGVFEIEVMPGKEFSLKAYHYKDKYAAKFNGIMPVIASGEIVDNRI